MSVRRVLSFYDMNSDELADEIDLSVPIETLKTIIVADDDDPALYGVYPLDRNQFLEFQKLIPMLSHYDFKIFYIYYECFSY